MADKKETTKPEEKKSTKKNIAKKESPTIKKGDWNILKYPHLSEKSISNVETQNKIVFIVKSGSKRKDVKKAVESTFDVKVKKINMLTTTKGQKKAYIRLKAEYSALDIATRLGMM